MVDVTVTQAIKDQILRLDDSPVSGTHEERMICALTILSWPTGAKITAWQLFTGYKALCDVLAEGSRFYLMISPEFKRHPIFKNIRSLKGKKRELFSRQILGRIASFLSGGDARFVQEIERQFLTRIGSDIVIVKDQRKRKTN